MTDKTSTAPVMSLQQVRDWHDAQANDSDNLAEARMHLTMSRSISSMLNAPTPDVVGGGVVAWQCRCRLGGEWSEWQECEKDDFDKRTPLSGWDDGYLETEYRQLCVYAAPRVQGDAVAVRDALETCERWFVAHAAVAPLIGGHGHAEHPMLTTIRAALAAQPKGDADAADEDAQDLRDLLSCWNVLLKLASDSGYVRRDIVGEPELEYLQRAIRGIKP